MFSVGPEGDEWISDGADCDFKALLHCCTRLFFVTTVAAAIINSVDVKHSVYSSST